MPSKTAPIGRRIVLSGVGAGLAAPFIRPARAQESWPTKPVRIIMPYAPGGAGDTVARPWADRLSHAFGVPFVVENRGGASGTIGVEAAARATPDGTTFLITPNSAINVVPQLRKVGYDARKDLLPVGRIGDVVGGFGLVPGLGIDTMAGRRSRLVVASPSWTATATAARICILRVGPNRLPCIAMRPSWEAA